MIKDGSNLRDKHGRFMTPSAPVNGTTPLPAERLKPPLRQPPRRRRRRSRPLSLEAEIRKSAQQIFESGMAEAMRAAALMICARKLDEVKSLLVASGLSSLNGGVAMPSPMSAPQPSAAQPSPPPPPPVIKNPCVQCGRPGVYRTKPSQFNRTGSWYCRAHMALGTGVEAEDQMDRVLTPAPPPSLSSVPSPELVPEGAPQGAPPPGAGSLAEAMGLAQVVSE